MPSNFDFSALVPEHDTFTDVDRQVYEVRSGVDFGAVDLARITRLRREMPAVLEQIEREPEAEAPAARFELMVDESLRLILPSLPAERITAMALGQKAKIFEWWNAQELQRSTQGASNSGEAPAGQSA